MNTVVHVVLIVTMDVYVVVYLTGLPQLTDSAHAVIYNRCEYHVYPIPRLYMTKLFLFKNIKFRFNMP